MSKAEILLGMVNSYNHSMTCTAYAPSKGRRCRNPLNIAKRAFAHQILDEIDASRVDPVRTYDKLLQLAETTASCQVRAHHEQAVRIADGWFVIIQKDIERSNITDAAASPIASVNVNATPVRPPIQTQISITSTSPSASIRSVPTSRTSTTADVASTHSGTGHTSLVRAAGSGQTTIREPHESSIARANSTSEVPRSRAPPSSTSAKVDRTHNGADQSADATCSICLLEMCEPLRTPCGHTFCRECLSSWFGGATRKSCPMDRRSLAWDDVVDVWVEENTCGICLEVMDDPCSTPCGHRFCCGCLRTMFNGARRQRCPMDRREMTWDDLQRVSLRERAKSPSAATLVV